MVAELIDKYIWLIQTFINAGKAGLTLKQLERKWENRYNESYPRRSFNNHRESIADIFGIEIECDRSTNCYYISDGEDITDQDSSRQWLINTFTVNNLLSMGKERLSGRVSVEDIPSGQLHLTTIMAAMDSGNSLVISYRKYTSSVDDTLTVDPYAVKESQKRWYLVGWCHERNAMRVYGLDRITRMDVSDKTFTLPANFNVDELFCESYGIYLPEEGQNAVTITFRTSEKEARYLRDLPLHESQKELSRENGSVTFSIRVIPNEALVLDLCRLGGRISILSPESVRKRVLEEHEEAIRNNNRI